VEGAGSIQKYLATTRGKWLDIRSLIKKEKPVV